MKSLMLFLLILPYTSVTIAQIKTCKELKEGVFYSYPKNSSKQYQLTRKGDIQTEKDLSTGDSSLWKISWLNDCTYSLYFISGSAKLTDESRTFAKAHSLITKIESTTDDFYSYHIYIDKVAGKYLLADTIWFQKKLVAANNTMFEHVPATTSLKKINFSSKSPFALLYVYRPHKFIAGKVDYLLYFDENIMCTSKNGTGYIFKIFKEGDFNLLARIYNEKDVTLNVHIKFGDKVFVKSEFKTISFDTNGLRPKLLVIDAEKGSEEFSAIEVQ
jgi:hypothetical protein